MLDDSRVDDLVNLIQDSFRIRLNHDPVYVDVAGHLKRVSSPQHQILFGRRGSGKSCLLVHFLNKEKNKRNETTPIYINVDEFKRLDYPDLLIRLILSVMEKLPPAKSFWRRNNPFPDDLQKAIRDLRNLLDKAQETNVVESKGEKSGFEGGLKRGPANLKGSNETIRERSSEFKESKLEELERHLSDYKDALRWAAGKLDSKIFVLVDDFYLIPKKRQPDVIDYLHRLFRSTNYYLKVGTVRHRTNLIRNNGQVIGVELHQDVEEINLDRTFEDLDATTEYLSSMLDSMAGKVGLDDISNKIFNPDALQALVLASGGVPRDFLNIFVEGIDTAIASGKTRWLTPTHIWKGASRISYRTKIKNLRDDASDESSELERVYRDLIRFCLSEKQTTAFLISQEEVQKYPATHELINQLMDFKLIHVIEPDTSAASGRKGRFEAYTLDFSLFMEPRKRNINHVEFWKYDDNYRRMGVREAPTYDLKRAKNAATSEDHEETEKLIEQIDD